MPNTDIKTLAFEWARQYRKILREDYLAAFQNIWKPRKDFMPHILKQLNGKSGTASISSTAGQGKRQKDKQKKYEQIRFLKQTINKDKMAFSHNPVVIVSIFRMLYFPYSLIRLFFISAMPFF
jgi:hypothetical protein